MQDLRHRGASGQDGRAHEGALGRAAENPALPELRQEVCVQVKAVASPAAVSRREEEESPEVPKVSEDFRLEAAVGRTRSEAP